MVGSRAGGSPAGRTQVADSPAGRSPVAGIRVDRSPVVDTPAADTRAGGSPVAGTVVDQASQAAVQGGRQAVSSPDNAPDVVAHVPILSTGGVFLNVPPISVA